MNLVVKLFTFAACPRHPDLIDLLPATNQGHQSLATNVSWFVGLCHFFSTYSLYSVLLMRGFSFFREWGPRSGCLSMEIMLRLLMTESCGHDKGLKRMALL